MHAPPTAPTAPATGATNWRWSRPAVTTIAALTAVNLFNYMDRFVLSALYTQLGQPVAEGGLGLDKGQQGDLYSAFIIVYSLTAPAFGVLGDRVRRTWLLAGAALLWTLATGACGLAQGMMALLIARACTGIGEAAYASITPSIVSDLVPAGARGRALATFNAAIPVGSAMAFIVGGAVAARYGWRHAFWVAAVPGLFLVVWILFLREPKRGAMDAAGAGQAPGGAASARVPLVTTLRALVRRPFVLPVLGYILQTAGFGALAIWAPSFLEEAKGMSLETATTMFGVVVVTSGLLGTVAGGWLGDRWLRADPRGLMWLCATTSLAAVPCVIGVIYAHSPAVIWPCIGAGCLLLVMSVGPVNAQIVNVLGPRERATGVAVCTTLIHLLGDVPSVPVIGNLVDHLTAQHDRAHAWEQAFMVVPACILAGALAWLAAGLWGRLTHADAGSAGANTGHAEARA